MYGMYFVRKIQEQPLEVFMFSRSLGSLSGAQRLLARAAPVAQAARAESAELAKPAKHRGRARQVKVAPGIQDRCRFRQIWMEVWICWDGATSQVRGIFLAAGTRMIL